MVHNNSGIGPCNGPIPNIVSKGLKRLFTYCFWSIIVGIFPEYSWNIVDILQEYSWNIRSKFPSNLGPSFLQISVQVSLVVAIRFPRDLPSFGSHVK